MQIGQISNINYSNYQNKKTSLYSSDTVNFKGNKLEKLSRYFTLPNNKLKTYSIEDYKNLTELDKKILRFEYQCSKLGYKDNFCQNTETIHDKITDYMKESLDKKYGEGKYVVLTIGRSLSSIGKVLGYKIGEENVINIPLSRAHRFATQNAIKETSQNEIEGFEKYLNTVGLTKEKIKTSDKKYILTDYCFSGASLNGTKQLFSSKKLFGNKKNIFTENIYSLIPKTPNNYNLRATFFHYLYESKLKPYSFVDKSTDLKTTTNSVKNPQKANKCSKLMWFKLLDNFMRGKKVTQKELNNIKCDYILFD